MDQIASRLFGTSALSTLAQYAALPGPPQRVFARIGEVEAPYEFVPGDVTTADGYKSIAPTGGTAGRWLLRSNQIRLLPLGGGVDDRPRLQAALIALQGYASVIMGSDAGAWTIATQLDGPGSCHILGEPGTVVNITAGAGVSAFKFVATTGGTTGALTANITLGSDQFSDNALHAVNTDVKIGATGATNIHIGQRYQILAVAPGVPNVYTVDRPIDYPFVIGDPVREIVSGGKDIVIEGRGMTWNASDVLEYFIQAQATRLRVDNLRMVSTANGGSAAISVELSSYDCKVTKCEVLLPKTNTMIAFFNESAEACGFADCTSRGGLRGHTTYDCVDCFADNIVCSEWSSLGSLLSTHPALVGPGTKNQTMKGCSFRSGANIGSSVQYATDCKFIGCSSDYNVQGFNTGTSAGVAIRTRYIGCSVVGNTSGQYTYVNTATASGTEYIGCTGVGSGAGRLIAAECVFSECDETGCTVSTNFPMVIQATIAAGSRVRCVGGLISPAAGAGAQPLVQKAGSCIASFEGTLFAMTAAGQTAITDSTAGCVILRDVIMTQTAASLGYVSTANVCTVRITGRCDMGTIGTPTTIFAGANINRGTIVANGLGTVQAVAFPDLKLDERIELTMSVLAGPAAGTVPAIVYTPGTGFSFQSEVNNTSTYQWKIT